MLSDFSFAKLKNLSFTHYIIAGLLVVHTGWIVTHLNLVAGEYINPWKLGGYGMYTKPSNRAKLHVYDIRKKAKRLSKKTYVSKSFRNSNFRFIFRCRQFSEASFSKFLNDNPYLVNVDLKFHVRERKFTRKPVGTKWFTLSVAEIKWLQKDKFTYSGEVCGKQYAGEVEYRS